MPRLGLALTREGHLFEIAPFASMMDRCQLVGPYEQAHARGFACMPRSAPCTIPSLPFRSGVRGDPCLVELQLRRCQTSEILGSSGFAKDWTAFMLRRVT